MCQNNIAYTNKTCKEVSKKIRYMKGIKDEYIVGEELICRKYIKTNGKKFNVNIKYEIVSIDGDKFILKNVGIGEEQGIVRKLLQKKIIYAYCYTCHSKQGCSVDDDIVIYDWNKWHVEREWFYTCVTRATDLNRVTFFKYEDDEDTISRNDVENYFRKKVASYKEQDKRAGRDIEGDDYVDVEFLMGMMNTNCECCGEVLTIDIDNGNIVSNISCQRVDCQLPHYKSNYISFYDTYCTFSDKISL